MRRLLLAALFVLPAAHAQLPPEVAQQLAAASIPQDAMGALVLRGDTALVSHFAERPMQPASAIKLVTTLVALEQLGPAFRGRTEIRTAAPLVQDTLLGDLILRGGADADLDGEALRDMLQALRNQGVRKVQGRLVLDRTLFNPTRPDPGLPPFDEAPDAYYNVIPDALLINKNMLLLDMRSTDRTMAVTMQPQLERVTIESAMTLITADCARWEDGWQQPKAVRQADGSIKVVLRGTFPRNCARNNSINVVDRHDYVDRLVRHTWQQLGGELTGPTVEAITPPGTRLLADHVSRALPEVVRDINKPSDNALARTVFLSLGSLEADPVAGSRPLPLLGIDTATRADVAIRSWMRRQGINDTGMVLDNGSGLSRLEKISPLQLASTLQAGLRSKWSPEFMASLPIAGVDGTLRRRLRDSAAFERARLKTGGLRNVMALAGYVTDATGRQCVVVVFVNSEQAGSSRPAIDALIDWVARSGQ
ncbi:D-alanyl-D-alanine carboxypeptidase/D-alanyl-D-alanine-endopeptidase [Massilia sp. PAMC28688]|uniref:D-alanyl-D-alanine carboxypeptidase/D-alanyl-D-alanine endopeptidase n=1 Tax=Massilia sp. PAMC28688 TaxID=2861283 RepID=UPI001C636D02|nr:D-alanyl-D-alanine carboxypeptidase/D-alanyl-D-alanine-endopeptidase [Massilia sp. PAMC28688]QYF95298.1 D-alanyl-D-alanine carboxypeptidase/D-alanyl-D-alanine-endopeptidase [Massilia sp. PAMC28688]